MHIQPITVRSVWLCNVIQASWFLFVVLKMQTGAWQKSLIKPVHWCPTWKWRLLVHEAIKQFATTKRSWRGAEMKRKRLLCPRIFTAERNKDAYLCLCTSTDLCLMFWLSLSSNDSAVLCRCTLIKTKARFVRTFEILSLFSKTHLTATTWLLPYPTVSASALAIWYVISIWVCASPIKGFGGFFVVNVGHKWEHIQLFSLFINQICHIYRCTSWDQEIKTQILLIY